MATIGPREIHLKAVLICLSFFVAIHVSFFMNSFSSAQIVFGSLEPFPSTNFPIKNFPTKGFRFCKVCLYYTGSSDKVFFHCENPFHYLSFGHINFHKGQKFL